jgi:hypothetical protein
VSPAKGLAARLQVRRHLGQVVPHLLGELHYAGSCLLVEMLAVLMQLVYVVPQLSEKIGEHCHKKPLL